MNDKFLQRDDVPFASAAWPRIDAAVTGAARARLCVRRLLEVEGPYGYALESTAAPGSRTLEEGDDESSARVNRVMPVPELEASFELPIRDLAAFEENGQPFDVGPAVRAAVRVAEREDALLLKGSDKLGIKGLLNSPGVQSLALASWDAVGAGLGNVLQAVGKLEEAGHYGPYALALAPGLYNLLFRLFPQTARSELEQLREVATAGIVKAPALKQAGLLVAANREVAAIVVGRDLETSFVGPSGRRYEFAVSESVALQLRDPSAVCVLK